MTLLAPANPTNRPKWGRFQSFALQPYQLDRTDVPLLASAGAGGSWESHLCFEGLETGDGREIAPGALKLRPGPSLPLMGLDQRTFAHMLARACGSIVDFERRDGVIYGAGTWGATELGEHFEQLATPDDNGNTILHWVSVDLEVKNYEYVVNGYDDDGYEQYLLRITDANLMGATMVPFPAFSRAFIAPKGGRLEQMAAASTEASYAIPGTDISMPGPITIAASAKPQGLPAASYFTDPGFKGPTHLRVHPVDNSGWQRVTGHLADWTVPHIGVGNGSIYAPHSAAAYAYFCTGSTNVSTDGLSEDGLPSTFRTGVISLGGGHADVSLGYRGASEHYDNVCAGVADVVVGEDAFGPWVSGVIRPGVTAEQVRVLMASDISGDWRRVAGSMELVGILAVNVAGFPVRDSLAASAVVDFRAAFTASADSEEGEMTALVAAGMLRQNPAEMELAQVKRRLVALERALEPFRGLGMAYLANQMTNGNHALLVSDIGGGS